MAIDKLFSTYRYLNVTGSVHDHECEHCLPGFQGLTLMAIPMAMQGAAVLRPSRQGFRAMDFRGLMFRSRQERIDWKKIGELQLGGGGGGEQKHSVRHRKRLITILNMPYLFPPEGLTLMATPMAMSGGPGCLFSFGEAGNFLHEGFR